MAAPGADKLFRLMGLGELRHGEIAQVGRISVRNEKRISGSSDASVYEVEWLGIRAAAKVLHHLPGQSSTSDDSNKKLQQFGKEIILLSTLRHPNVCQLLGVGTVDGGLPAMVVELLERTLYECSVGDGRLADATLTLYLVDVLAGVRYLHSRDPPVIHRDLTLQNVVIKGKVAKLCDLGSARKLQTDLIGWSADVSKAPGHLLYMPPEALSTNPDYNASLDVFSFGVLAISVLSGHGPSADLLTSPRREQHITSQGTTTAPITEVDRRRADCERISDHPLGDSILRCLANVPGDRPSAEEMHTKVKEVADSHTEQEGVARRPTRMEVSHVTAAEQRADREQLLARTRATEEQMAGMMRQVTARLEAIEQLTGENRQVSAILDAQGQMSEQIAAFITRSADSLDQHRSDFAMRLEEQKRAAEDKDAAMDQKMAALTTRTHAMIQEQNSTMGEQLAGMERSTTELRTLVKDNLGTIASHLMKTSKEGTTGLKPSAIFSTRLSKERVKTLQGRDWSLFMKCDVPATLVVHDDRLIIMLTDADGRICEVRETTDLSTWYAIDLPREYQGYSHPSLASNGKALFMHCLDAESKPVVLQYSAWGKGDQQWRKLTDVPVPGHMCCTLQATDNFIRLYGGQTSEAKSTSVSVYDLREKDWHTTQSGKDVLPEGCAKAALVQCGGTMYLVGGTSSCWFQLHNTAWRKGHDTSSDSLHCRSACAVSEDCMAILKISGRDTTSCVLRYMPSGREIDLSSSCERLNTKLNSLVLFKNTLVAVGSKSLFSLDISELD
eukprot:scpid37784/ scgid5174/ Serine/threonine-protein kinase CTR1